MELDCRATSKVHRTGAGRVSCGNGLVDATTARKVSRCGSTSYGRTKGRVTRLFPAEILDRLSIVEVWRTGETIPYPPFYERVREGGARVVPDAAHMTAIPFIDVAVFNREPTLRTLFHALVHVTQFRMVGLERVMKGYFHTLNESGLWMVVTFEEQAYQLDARYTKDPFDTFSVEAEVREWLRSGKF